MAADFDFRT